MLHHISGPGYLYRSAKFTHIINYQYIKPHYMKIPVELIA